MTYRDAAKIESGYHVKLKWHPGKRYEIAGRTWRHSVEQPNRLIFTVRNVDDPNDVLFDVLHTDIKECCS